MDRQIRLKRTYAEFRDDHESDKSHRRNSTPWSCIYCCATNEGSSTVCKSCNAWICGKCHTVNPQYENECTQNQCNTAHTVHSSSKQSVLQNAGWNCPRCTMLNLESSTKCEICHTLKPEDISSKSAKSTSDEWSCSICTFKNIAISNHCKMCQNERTLSQITSETSKTTKHSPVGESVEMKDMEIDPEIHLMATTELKRFGHSKFRKLQYPVIEGLIRGENTMLILPTGGGKSLCFQIPILVLNTLCNKQQIYPPIQKGLGIVISPLISLMNDQIHKLQSLGIDCEFINSSLSKRQRDDIERRLKNQEIEILYVAPELFNSTSNRIVKLLTEHRIITLLVVDEAHCISEWGHNFRPSYSRLAALRGTLYDPTTMICTATATAKVRDDILKQLDLNRKSCKVHMASFDRPNLYLQVIDLRASRYRGKKMDDVIVSEIFKYHQERGTLDHPVIVYCGTRKETDITEAHLRRKFKSKGITVGAYHAGLSGIERKRVQKEFMENKLQIIAATNAFGMGIDKDNVGLIIHKMCPSSIEEYYQQIGRAGRDGRPSRAVLFVGDSGWVSDFSEFCVNSSNPKNFVIEKVASIICSEFELNQANECKLTQLLERTGFGMSDHVTTQTMSAVIKMMDKHGVLKRVPSQEMPLKITFMNGDPSRMRRDTVHWRLWKEISQRERHGPNQNELEIIIWRMLQILGIDSKQLTKSLSYLKSKKLLVYDNLKRSGSIILLNRDWRSLMDWKQIDQQRNNAQDIQQKIRALTSTRRCRRQYLLNYFAQHYVVGSNPRCCDNCG